MSYEVLIFTIYGVINFKGALRGLSQFLGTESPLKTMKNSFYFTMKALSRNGEKRLA